MCDQIFPLVAYRAKNLLHILDGLDTYMHEVTVLAPSVWDPSTRLEPPKKLPSIHQRLTNLREHQHSSSNLARNNSFNSGVQFNLANEQRQSSYNNILDDVSLNLFHSKSDKSFGEGGDDEDAHKKMAGKQDKGRHGKDDDTLKYTGKIFGGLILDIKRKLPWYLSDFKDGLNIQSVATIIYIYLATITKAITFGGFLGDITDGQQGVLESFLGHALVGGIFCLFGGQPLTVVGCTGPVLIFEKIMVEFCASYKMDYMTMRLWIGLWASLFCVIIVAVDASAAIRYITRFTEESFAALIGIIFIAESLKKLYSKLIIDMTSSVQDKFVTLFFFSFRNVQKVQSACRLRSRTYDLLRRGLSLRSAGFNDSHRRGQHHRDSSGGYHAAECIHERNFVLGSRL